MVVWGRAGGVVTVVVVLIVVVIIIIVAPILFLARVATLSGPPFFAISERFKVEGELGNLHFEIREFLLGGFKLSVQLDHRLKKMMFRGCEGRIGVVGGRVRSAR